MSYQKQEWRNDDTQTPLSAERLTHIEDGVAAAYVKAGTGIPATDLDQSTQTKLSTVDGATDKATANTVMKRNSTGAVSVGDATADSHAVNKKTMDAALNTLAKKLGQTYP